MCICVYEDTSGVYENKIEICAVAENQSVAHNLRLVNILCHHAVGLNMEEVHRYYVYVLCSFIWLLECAVCICKDEDN